jgi:hypothetical protein
MVVLFLARVVTTSNPTIAQIFQVKLSKVEWRNE